MREIEKALFEIQKVIAPVARNATNDYFDSTYTTLEAVNQLARTHANHYGILILQTAGKDADGHFIKTQLIHTSGEQIEEKLYLIIDKVSMQGLGSAITYARRYSIVLIFGIDQEDDDGNKASHQKQPAQQARPSATPQQAQRPQSPPAKPTPQPAKTNPIADMAGMITFGKYKGNTIQNIISTPQGKEELRGYVDFLKRPSDKPRQEFVTNFINEAEMAMSGSFLADQNDWATHVEGDINR